MPYKDPERKRQWEQAHKQQRSEQYRVWEQAHREQRTERMRAQRETVSLFDSDPQAADDNLSTWAFFAFIGAIVGAPLLLFFFRGSSENPPMA